MTRAVSSAPTTRSRPLKPPSSRNCLGVYSGSTSRVFRAAAAGRHGQADGQRRPTVNLRNLRSQVRILSGALHRRPAMPHWHCENRAPFDESGISRELWKSANRMDMRTETTAQPTRSGGPGLIRDSLRAQGACRRACSTTRPRPRRNCVDAAASGARRRSRTRPDARSRSSLRMRPAPRTAWSTWSAASCSRSRCSGNCSGATSQRSLAAWP